MLYVIYTAVWHNAEVNISAPTKKLQCFSFSNCMGHLLIYLLLGAIILENITKTTRESHGKKKAFVKNY